LVKEIKTGSSRWLKSQPGVKPAFVWQRGYGAFSVSQSHLARLIQHIDNQERHHNKVSFKEEYLAFLKSYEIDCDEKYLWSD